MAWSRSVAVLGGVVEAQHLLPAVSAIIGCMPRFDGFSGVINNFAHSLLIASPVCQLAILPPSARLVSTLFTIGILVYGGYSSGRVISSPSHVTVWAPIDFVVFVAKF